MPLSLRIVDTSPSTPTRPRRTPLAVLGWCLAIGVSGAVLPETALAAGPTTPAPAAAPPTARGRRILVLGLDGADWRAIDPLVAKGALPTFAKLRASGRTGLLLATPPLVSPIIWTTIATGRRPEDHRILDFMLDLPGGGQAPIPSSERRVAALWNVFSGAGRTVDVIGWWATWPAEDVRGTVVSDRVAPQLARTGSELDPRAISPAGAAAALARDLVHATDLRLADLAAYVPLTAAEEQAAHEALLSPGGRLYRDPIAHLATIVASTRSYGRIAESLLATGQPDLLLVYLEEIDSLSHRFVKDERRGERAIAQAYRDADALLARLAERVAPDTWLVVVSDHGFYGRDAAIGEDPAELAGPATAWHRPYGIVAAAEARQLAAGAPGAGAVDVGSVTPLDVAPTVLQAAGLPISREMPGRVVSALLPDEARARPAVRVDSFERPLPQPAALAPSAEARDRLQALGYVAAGASSLARLNLGEILYRRGDYGGAERELREVVAEQPTSVPALLWLAKSVRELGRTATALDLYARVLALPGDNGDALVEAVDLAAGERLLEQARRLLALARPQLRPRSALPVARAIVARLEKRPAVVERELRAALAFDPTYLPALERWLEVAVAAPDTSASLTPLRIGAERAAGSPRHQALFGTALLATGHAAEAEGRLTRALALAPDGVSVRLELARAQLAQRKPDPALALLTTAPPSAERSVLVGAARSQKGQWTEAAAAYEAALAAQTPTPELLNGLAWARLQTGRRADAMALLARSLSLDPNQPEIRRLLDDTRRRER